MTSKLEQAFSRIPNPIAEEESQTSAAQAILNSVSDINERLMELESFGQEERDRIGEQILLLAQVLNFSKLHIDDEEYGGVFQKIVDEANTLAEDLYYIAEKGGLSREDVNNLGLEKLGLVDNLENDAEDSDQEIEEVETPEARTIRRVIEAANKLVSDSIELSGQGRNLIYEDWQNRADELRRAILALKNRRSELNTARLALLAESLSVKADIASQLATAESSLMVVSEMVVQLENTLHTLETGEESIIGNPFAQSIRQLRARISTLFEAIQTAEQKEWDDQNVDELRAEISRLNNQAANWSFELGELRERIILSDQIKSEDRNSSLAALENLSDTLKNLDTGIGRLRDKLKEIESSNNNQDGRDEALVRSLRENIKRQLERIAATEVYTLIDVSNNPLSEAFIKIEDTLSELRNAGETSEEITNLEYEMMRLKFQVIKASIIFNLERFEDNEDGSSALDEYNVTVLKNMLTEMRAICNLVPAAMRQRFLDEYNRFHNNEYLHILKYYIASKSLRNDALGMTASGQQQVPKVLPSATTVYTSSFSDDYFGGMMHPRGLEICTDPELRSPREKEVNPIIGRREVTVFDPSTERIVNKEIEITAIGQCMRWMDILLSGRVPEFETQRRDINTLSMGELHRFVVNLETKRLDNLFESDRAANPAAAISRSDEKYQVKIEELHVRRAFNIAIFLYKHFSLAHSSFNGPAPGYYQFNPEYVLSEVIDQYGHQSGLIAFSIFGLSSDALVSPSNPDGVNFVLDNVAPQREGRGLIHNLVKLGRPQNARQAVSNAVRHINHHHPNRYDFLTNLPLLPLMPKRTAPTFGKAAPYTAADYKGEKYQYRMVVTPMTNMLVRGADGTPLHMPVQRPDGSLNFRDHDSAYMTFENMIDFRTRPNRLPTVAEAQAYYAKHGYLPDPNGEIMYEELPFKTHENDKTTSLAWWINQAENIIAFYKEVFAESATGLMGKSDQEIMNSIDKRIKYAIALLEPYAHHIRYGEYSFDEMKRRLILTIMFIQGMLMMVNGESIEHVKERLNNYKINDDEGIHAVVHALEAAFGFAGLTNTVIDKFTGQILNSIKLD